MHLILEIRKYLELCVALQLTPSSVCHCHSMQLWTMHFLSQIYITSLQRPFFTNLHYLSAKQRDIRYQIFSKMSPPLLHIKAIIKENLFLLLVFRMGNHNTQTLSALCDVIRSSSYLWNSCFSKAGRLKNCFNTISSITLVDN